MTIQYEEYTNISGEEYLIKIEDNGTKTWVPCKLDNADYQAYLNRDNPDWGKPLL